jgi:hypothetical protein
MDDDIFLDCDPPPDRCDSLNCIDVVIDGPETSHPRQATSAEIANLERGYRRLGVPLLRYPPGTVPPEIDIQDVTF